MSFPRFVSFPRDSWVSYCFFSSSFNSSSVIAEEQGQLVFLFDFNELRLTKNLSPPRFASFSSGLIGFLQLLLKLF